MNAPAKEHAFPPSLIFLLTAASNFAWVSTVKMFRLALVVLLPVLVFLATVNYALPAISNQPNECNDQWTTTTTTDAPTGRSGHTGVWTGTEMIVWGGSDYISVFDTGGRYNSSTDSWTPTSTTNAPSGRVFHTAVWTGSEMIVWGGLNNNFVDRLNTGGRYCGQPGPPFILDARVRRQGSKRFVALTWSPADGGSINVLRNGMVVDTTDDDGAAQDKLWNQTGTFVYQVCETDTGDCSNQVRVVVRGSGD